MNELQIKLLEMLDYFHHLCIEKGLRYYVVGGTALGTVRHQGFIPWDDDIDVAMPRPDYERLKEISKTLRLDNYILEYPGTAKDFVYPYGKMYDTSTTLIENTKYATKRGIFIDIFPIDGLGTTKEESIKKFRSVDGLYNLFSTKTCAIRKGRIWYKNLALNIMRLIPDFIINPHELMKKIEATSKKISYDNSVYVANLVGNWHEKEITLKEYFGEPTEYNFENIIVLGPEKIDAYLTNIYGNWRKLPPKEKQKSHHDFKKLDLYKSYLEN